MTNTTPPAGYRVKDWRRAAGGISHGLVYKLINAGRIEIAKIGRTTVILTPPGDFLRANVVKRAA